MFSGLPFKYLFISVMAFGTIFSLSSSHWLGIWAGLEINLMGFLPVLVYQKSMLESESAVKYFIIQALGSSLLMFGSLFSYNTSLSWEALSSGPLSASSSLILCLGLLLKMGVFPFHFWFPSVMSGISWSTCLLLATWQKLAPAFLVASALESMKVLKLAFLFCFLGAVSSLVGGFGGLNQTQVRALLAYSSIGHMGWILFAMSTSEAMMKVYFLIYILISICLFFSLWVLNMNNFKDLSSMSSLGWNGNFGFLFILLSLGGLPPLLGFISKWAVITSGVSATSWGLLFGLILGSLMSLFYYLSLFFSQFLSLKGETLAKSSKTVLSGGVYTNLILLVNLFGGAILFLLLPVSFM